MSVHQSHKDLPAQLAVASQPLRAALVIASFGPSTGYNSHVFNLDIQQDPQSPFPVPETPLRYGKLEEIHHTFRADAKSPPKIISIVFAAAILATLPVLGATVRMPVPPAATATAPS